MSTGTPDRVSLFFVDSPLARKQIDYAKYAEQKGFEAIWICETRMARDAISILGAIAYVTKKIKLGSAVINCWSRIAPLIALTWATLDEMAPGRTILGIGAWWDPLASKAGVERNKPLTRMRDYVTIMRRLLNLKTVTYRGESAQVRDLYLDLGHGVPRKPKNVPIMIGATGFKMLELAGEIGDGVILNFFLSPEYNRKAVQAIEKGVAKSGRKINQIDRPQLIACSMNDDADKALNNIRYMVTMYLGQQPHIMKASGVKQSLIKEINRTLGGWPPKQEGLEKATLLVDDKIVQLLTASGTPDDCRNKVREYVKAGTTLPMICPIGENIREMVDVFAEGYM